MKIELFDTTLRDGAQARNVSYSLKDKLSIVEILDEIGMDYIEAGNPGSNPKDVKFFQELEKMKFKNSKIVAFGSTRRKNVNCEDDILLNKLVDSFAEYVTIFGKSWDFHVTDIIRTTLDENLMMISDTIKYLTDKGKTVFFDAEHFFDGYLNNPEYALKVLEVASKSGAKTLVLCDTNGGCFPQQIADITKIVSDKFPNCVIGIHVHDDTGMAVANSHASIDAGALHIQGVFTGFGERCGNANLSTIIANLKLKKNIDVVTDEQLSKLTKSAIKISEISNIRLSAGMPYVGKNAFAHKGGMHIDGVLKANASFEHTNPSFVGNQRDILISEVSGKAAILKEVQKINPSLSKESSDTVKVIDTIKKYEQQGYQFELADASLELLINKKMGVFVPSFDILYYEVRDISSNGFLVLSTMKMKIADEERIISAEGKGPVHALDQCLRIVLEEFYPLTKELKLEDYKVRVLDSDQKTDAGVRVIIQSADCKDKWTTIGVSHNVIKASLIALVDSFEYKLMKDTKESK